ncbi:MarR family winged helix-turn-helix transcriptional regulator [Nonomuraea sp. NPDC000554]|uniref:MarR family winged helix-turn-helix transcriptional regulator n=1 Tax=Nonomuraea sp. NPDC000554 TaxID=3154259 RepID=UPI00332E2A10
MPEGEDLVTTVGAYRRLVTTLHRAKTHERLTEAAGVRLDRPDVQVLVYLLDAGEPCRIGAIAEGLQVESPHVTRHVSQLERRGLLERVRDPDDGRAWRIALTPEGADAAARCRQVTLEWFEAAVEGWPESDRAELARLLSKLSDDVCAHLQLRFAQSPANRALSPGHRAGASPPGGHSPRTPRGGEPTGLRTLSPGLRGARPPG